MKKLLSIFTSFTAISAVAPTVVACNSDAITLESLVKEIATDEGVINAAKAYSAGGSVDPVTIAVEIKLTALLAEKLKDQKEVATVLAIIHDGHIKYNATKGTDKVTIKITKDAWDDKFATDESKKADIKATYELISGDKAEADISTKA